MKGKYRVVPKKSGWFVIGPKVHLGPYLTRYQANLLLEELNVNVEIGEAMRKQKQGKR